MAPPSDAELDTWIRARLSLAGIDLDDLDPTLPNPDTGSPSQAQLLASLRNFLRTTPGVINSWLPPPPAGSGGVEQLQQHSAPPVLYPSIVSAWTGKDEG